MTMSKVHDHAEAKKEIWQSDYRLTTVASFIVVDQARSRLGYWTVTVSSGKVQEFGNFMREGKRRAVT